MGMSTREFNPILLALTRHALATLALVWAINNQAHSEDTIGNHPSVNKDISQRKH